MSGEQTVASASLTINSISLIHRVPDTNVRRSWFLLANCSFSAQSRMTDGSDHKSSEPNLVIREIR